MRGQSRPEQDKLDVNEAMSGAGSSKRDRISSKSWLKRRQISPYSKTLVGYKGLSSERPKMKII